MRARHGSRGGLRGGVLAALVGATAGLLVVLLIGGQGFGPFGGGDGDGSSASAGDSSSSQLTDPEPQAAPSVLPAAGVATGPLPTNAGLAAALNTALKAPALGSRIGLTVVDPATGTALYSRDATRAQHPASTAKLVTAASALHLIGPNATLRTRTVAGATADEVVLVGGGDPTITVNGGGTYPRTASLDALAKQTATALKAASPAASVGTSTSTATPGATAAKPTVRLVLDDSLFTGPRTGPGWNPADVTNGLVARVSALTLDESRVAHDGDARYADPTAAMGDAFVKALKKYDVRVSGTTRGVAPAGAAQLGAVASPPVSALVERMLLDSDNDLAEALAHLSGVASGAGGSFAGGTAAAGATLGWLGIDDSAVHLVDGSGISTEDEIDAVTLGAVVTAATRTDRPELAALLSGLPVAGVTGSLATRFNGPTTRDARGDVRAKTGTLTGVSSLAGTVLDRDGRTLVFVVLADKASADTLAVRAALDRIAAVLASCGCR